MSLWRVRRKYQGTRIPEHDYGWEYWVSVGNDLGPGWVKDPESASQFSDMEKQRGEIGYPGGWVLEELGFEWEMVEPDEEEKRQFEKSMKLCVEVFKKELGR